jgi:hypothetical protein
VRFINNDPKTASGDILEPLLMTFSIIVNKDYINNEAIWQKNHMKASIFDLPKNEMRKN